MWIIMKKLLFNYLRREGKLAAPPFTPNSLNNASLLILDFWEGGVEGDFGAEGGLPRSNAVVS